MPMDEGPLGVWSAGLRGGGAALDAAAELDVLGWGALWIPGAGRQGIWADAEDLLRSAPRATVALGVMNIWGPDADRAPAEHARLTRLYGPRLRTGLGVGSPQSAAAAGGKYTTPLAVMNEYLDRLDAAPGSLPVQDRILGALGPKMAALAGRRTGGVHSFLVTPEATAATRAILGPDKFLAPYLPVTLETDPGRARQLIRDAAGVFIGFPSYQANLRRLGFTDDDLRPGGSDRLIDAVSAWGPIDVIAAKIRQYRDAGAGHVALHVLSAQPGLPLAAWRELAPLATAPR